MPISARVSATAGVLLGLTACEGQEPTFTAAITVTSSARVEDDRGPAMAGTARLEIVSDIDQEIALEELAIWARGGPTGDVDAIPWADVSTSRSWPLAVESDRTAVVEVEWRTSLPSACPDARYLLAAFATLIGTSGPPVEARDFSGDVTRPLPPEDLPWSWLVTTEGEVGGWGGDGLAVGAEDVAWSTAGGQLVRIDPRGITRVVGGSAWAGRLVASEDGAYTFRDGFDGGPLRLTAHDPAGGERWEAAMTGVEYPWLAAATADVVVASGVARGDVALGGA